MRVLIVDDSQDTAFVLFRLLEHAGHEPVIASDGQQALEMTERFRPEVVFLDIWLPKTNGYEVAKRIRLTLGSDHIRIIALSGVNPDPERDKEAGIDFHLIKPASLSDLLMAMGAGRPVRSEDDPSWR